MAFGDRVREARTASGLSQNELANAVNVTSRTIQNYESNRRPPKDMAIVKRLASALDVSITVLTDDEDIILMDAADKGGNKARNELRMLISRVSAMFAGGELGDEDKDAALQALTDAYWDAKEDNKKYTPKKYR